MKWTHLLIGLLFIICAIVQWNDPDYYIWIPVYLATAYLPLAHFFNNPYKLFSKILGVVLLVWSITYFPALWEWLSGGTPSIVGSMKAESPHIELIREVLGLFLCLIAAFYYSRK